MKQPLPKLAVLCSAILFALLLGLKSEAQRYRYYNEKYTEPALVMELGVTGGIMNCMTDIGGSKNSHRRLLGDVTFKKTHFSGGAYLAAIYNDFLAVRLDYNIGKVEAIDSLLKGAKHFSAVGRYERNLSFRSNIREIAMNVEFHPIYLTAYTNSDGEPPRLSPYISAGLGLLNFDPEANIDGRWVRLEPLRLEGQGFDEYPDRQRYKTRTVVLPVGIGLKYECSPFLTLRFEINRRFTNTDYLDDVSHGAWVNPELFSKYLPANQADLAARLYNRSPRFVPPQDTRPRGNPRESDAFWTAVIKMGFNINRKRY